jgi:hypothetical protein
MNLFLAAYGHDWYPRAYLGDIIGAAATLEDAQKMICDKHAEEGRRCNDWTYRWGAVYDVSTLSVVWEI